MLSETDPPPPIWYVKEGAWQSYLTYQLASQTVELLLFSLEYFTFSLAFFSESFILIFYFKKYIPFFLKHGIHVASSALLI